MLLARLVVIHPNTCSPTVIRTASGVKGNGYGFDDRFFRG